MKKELIAELFLKFEQVCYDYKGIECWSARELQGILGYTEWRNFLKVIDKAKDACTNAGENCQTILLTSTKWLKWVVEQKENWMILPSPAMAVT